jgi:Fe2+ or Zn2+ uptake regulation protein
LKNPDSKIRPKNHGSVIDTWVFLLYDKLRIIPNPKVFALTKQRKAILDVINSNPGHMTAEEIYMKVKKKLPSIAIGTVYRNLALMAEAGEIRRLPIPGSPDRFDRSTRPHEHAVCQKCGEVCDIFVDGMKEYLQQHTGMEITGYDLNLRCICEKCKERNQDV